MHNLPLKQIIGAVSIMALVLFLLILAAKLKDDQLISDQTSEKLATTLAKPLDPAAELKNPAEPKNVISGAFNLATPGNIVYHDKNNPSKKFHYKAIRSEKLKEKILKPTLKLEVLENGKTIWKNFDWAWIDYDQGILYFHTKTETNETSTEVANFTGNYQVLLELN